MEQAQEVCNLQDVVDRSNYEDFTPDIWDDDGDSANSFPPASKMFMEPYNEEIEILKKQVRSMIGAPDESTKQAEKMNLINTIERLGLSYHFEGEIEGEIDQIFANYNCKTEFDLFTVALHFRIFRQHGHKMPSAVFSRFKGGDGEFHKSLSGDIEGMLSLYEATHLRIHGDEDAILEEALLFTKTNLKLYSLSDPDVVCPLIMKQVIHALDQPLHRGIPRVEARRYIDIYQELPSKNDTILRLAKLDFNIVQVLHSEELSYIKRYWEGTGLITKGSYARKRLVEGYFWGASASSEPRYSLCRLILTKAFLMITLIDDTYDSYGTFEELQLLTDAIERWDMTACNQLPDNLKPVYRGLLKMYHEFDLELANEGMPHAAHYGKEAMKSMVRTYFVEAKWLKQKCMPPFDEYIATAEFSSNHFMLRTSLLGLGKYATVEAFEWIFSNPKIARASSIIGRLLNDLAGHEGQRKKKIASVSPSSVDCYMKQYEVSEEEAIDEIYARIEDAWKDVNEELLLFANPTAPASRRCFVMIFLNLTRLLDVVYKSRVDIITHPETLKNVVKTVYIDPIQL